VLRIDRDGNGLPGNPGVDTPASGLDPRIYTYGHRNPQGLAFRSNGQAYSVEHGPDRDDEVNLLVAGGNYGWDPVPDYNQAVPMTDTTKYPDARPAVWTSGVTTIAPSGATFLSGAQWEGWDGGLAIAVLKNMHLRVLLLNAQGVLLGERGGLANGVRLRSAVQGPDGNLYIATDANALTGGAIWKVTPS
jgi:aldose sugar dehydrogenase